AADAVPVSLISSVRPPWVYGDHEIMRSKKLRSFAELYIVLFGALLLSVHGVKDVVNVLTAAPTFPATAYGAGELVGQLIVAVCPLFIGVGLVIIAYRRGFFSRARVQDA